jgi:hypothetical protein
MDLLLQLLPLLLLLLLLLCLLLLCLVQASAAAGQKGEHHRWLQLPSGAWVRVDSTAANNRASTTQRSTAASGGCMGSSNGAQLTYSCWGDNQLLLLHLQELPVAAGFGAALRLRCGTRKGLGLSGGLLLELAGGGLAYAAAACSKAAVQAFASGQAANCCTASRTLCTHSSRHWGVPAASSSCCCRRCFSA